MNKAIRDRLRDNGHEDAVIFESPDYDNAIIGVTEDERVVYDFNAMVQCLVEADGMTELEAIEFIEYNAIRALPYVENGPIIMYPIDKEDISAQA